QVPARTGRREPLLLDVVHPLGVRRDEDVGGRPVLDLPGKRIAGGVGDRRLVSAGRLERARDGVERFLEARGGEDGDAVGPGEGGGREAEQQGCEAAHGRNIPPDITTWN